MEATLNSDVEVDLTMTSENVFTHIIEEIKKSKLNYYLQQSPYSAFISLKKSFQTDKSGTTIYPSSLHASESVQFSSQESDLLCKNKTLESDLLNLRELNTRAVSELQILRQKVKKLEVELSIKEEKSFSEQDYVKLLKDENEALNKNLNDMECSMKDLKIRCEDSEKCVKVKSEVAVKLNKELADTRVKYRQETSRLKKENKGQIKLLKKELGEKIKENLKLTNMLEEMKTESTDNNYDNDSAASLNIRDSILEETEMESVDQNTDTCADRNEVFCRHSP